MTMVYNLHRDLQTNKRDKFKAAVQSTNTNPKTSTKPGTSQLVISRVDIEEAVTDTLLHTGVSTAMLDTLDDVAEYVRRFSKAIAERPAK